MGQTSQYGLLDTFKRAKQAIITAYMAGGSSAEAAQANADNAILSQSYLRLEQPIVASANTINFPVLVNSSGSAARATEIRLDQQDAFFISNLAVYIAKASSATDVTFLPQTYPNSQIFTLGGVVTTGSIPLMALYNGYLKITINKSVIVPQYPMTNFMFLPQTQQTATTAGAALTQFDPTLVSLWEPNINLVGTKANNIQIIMPAGILNAALDANTYVIIIAQGVLAQNVTLMS